MFPYFGPSFRAKLTGIISKLRVVIRSKGRIHVVIHMNPDPDAAAAALLFIEFVRLVGGRRVQVYFQGSLPGTLQGYGLKAQPLTKLLKRYTEGDYVVLLDAPSCDMFHVAGDLQGALPIPDLALDHHLGRSNAVVSLIERRAPSASAIVLALIYEVLGEKQVEIWLDSHRALATLLHAALLSDCELNYDGTSLIAAPVTKAQKEVHALLARYSEEPAMRKILACRSRQEVAAKLAAAEARPDIRYSKGGRTFNVVFIGQVVEREEIAMIADGLRRMAVADKGSPETPDLVIVGGVHAYEGRYSLYLSLRSLNGVNAGSAAALVDGGGRKDRGGSTYLIPRARSKKKALSTGRCMFDSAVSRIAAGN